jgi:hypothetical protein
MELLGEQGSRSCACAVKAAKAVQQEGRCEIVQVRQAECSEMRSQCSPYLQDSSYETEGYVLC